jgi:HEAT repeat protein
MEITKNRAVMLVSLGALLGLGGLGWSLAGRQGPLEATTDDGPAAATHRVSRRTLEGRDSEAASGPCSLRPGTRMAYDVVTRTHTTLDMGSIMDDVRIDGAGLSAKATAMEQEAVRRWHVDLEVVARVTDGSTVWAAHIDAEATEVAGQGSQPAAEALANAFLVRVEPQCGIREFGWRSDGDLAAAQDQQQLLAGLQWLAPAEGERSWSGTSFDTLGRYHGAYAMADGGSITGRAVSYREPFGQALGAELPTLEVAASTIEVEPRVGEWFASLSNARELVIAMRGEPIGRVRGSVVARRAEPGQWQPAVELEDGGWSWGLLLGQRVPRTTEKAEASSKLAGVPVGDAVSQYLAMIHEGRSSVDTVAHLTEWLRANPEGTGELVAMLRAGAFEGEQSGSAGLFLALGKANTPAAGGALVGIITGADDSMAHKISAAHALSKVEAPTVEMVDAVVAVIERDDIHPMERGSLAMALGGFASRNEARAPELARQARDQIQGWLDAPSDTQALSGSLLAAGNAGHDDLAGAIEPYLEHSDPQIRQRAAHAMRHMSPEQAYPRLASRTDDEDGSVRASAFETAAEVSRANGIAPPEDMVDAAIGQLDEGATPREQQALLGLLGEAAGRGHDGAHAVLQQHFEDELRSDTRDTERLRALGRHAGTRWVAE